MTRQQYLTEVARKFPTLAKFPRSVTFGQILGYVAMEIFMLRTIDAYEWKDHGHLEELETETRRRLKQLQETGVTDK